MKELTTRERMLRTYRREEIDRILMVDSAWAGTVRRWQREGMPVGVDWQDHFGYDKIVRVCPDNSPRFPQRVIEENERYSIVPVTKQKTVFCTVIFNTEPKTLTDKRLTFLT